MQISVNDEDVEVLHDVVSAVLEHLAEAKEHTESCPSVESVEMLTEVTADYDYRVRVLTDIKDQMEACSKNV